MHSKLPLAEFMQDAYELVQQHWNRVVACAIPGTVLLVGWFWHRSNRDLPPGPRLMMFGNFFQPKTDEEVRQNALKLREKYGDIVSTRIFSNVYVILNSYDAIKAVYVDHGDSVAGRPQFNFGTRLDDSSSPGLVNAEGPVWQEHRRFVLSTLRDFGFGKKTTESMILEELQHLCKFFEEAGQGGKAVDVTLPLSQASTNTICSLVFGERCGCDKEFEEVMGMIHQNRDGNSVRFFVILIVQFLIKLPGDLCKFKRVRDNIDKIVVFVDEKIQAHRKKHTEGNDNDLIDAYLTAQAQHERQHPGKHSFNDLQLSRIVFELFFAATDTTATMLRWIFYLIAQRGDLQKKVQQEIDETLGHRLPSASDRSQLKFTEAVLYEIFRYVVMSPFGAPLHRVLKEVCVGGYRLPKGATIFTNLYTVFRDPKLWPYPDDFNPANFYDEQTKSLCNVEHLIPFLIGRRACSGEGLAKQELFLLFTGLLQRFSFSLDEEFVSTEKEPPANMFFRFAPSYRLIITPRS